MTVKILTHCKTCTALLRRFISAAVNNTRRIPSCIGVCSIICRRLIGRKRQFFSLATAWQLVTGIAWHASPTLRCRDYAKWTLSCIYIAAATATTHPTSRIDAIYPAIKPTPAAIVKMNDAGMHSVAPPAIAYCTRVYISVKLLIEVSCLYRLRSTHDCLSYTHDFAINRQCWSLAQSVGTVAIYCSSAASTLSKWPFLLFMLP